MSGQKPVLRPMTNATQSRQCLYLNYNTSFPYEDPAHTVYLGNYNKLLCGFKCCDCDSNWHCETNNNKGKNWDTDSVYYNKSLMPMLRLENMLRLLHIEI